MSFQVSDPLELLPYQTGLVAPPLEDGAAQGQNLLTATQRAIVLGEPVPIVFCRRVSGNGGVFVSPGATEARYENNATTNELTVNLQLVLSEGDMPQLQENDLYQRNCRVGTWYQTYNRRAGSWTPGNYIVTVAGKQPWNCPQYCGTSGTYANLTTLSFTKNYNDGDDTWDKQVHAFVREGLQVTRILDNTLGSSNNVVDLALYLIRQSSRLPESMLDIAAFTTAANFTNTNSFFYNGEFKESTNLEDWLQDISTKFLLRVSDNLGKKGFRPLLPINNDYTIKTTAISAVFTFTEDHILPNGFQIEYIPLSERKPICALMLWRQQPDSDVGVVRTAEVRFTGEATSGPYEQYDLSQFCTTENHAVKIGAYYVARRKYITHTLRIRVRPDVFNSTLVLGDIVRVRLQRETDVDIIDYHDYYYQVERINKSISGIIELDLMHFPVDNQNRSLIALAVASATGAGYVLPTGRNDFSCNVNNDSDAIADVGGNLGGLPNSSDFQTNLTAGSEGNPNEEVNNPEYPENYGQLIGATGELGQPVAGDTLSADNVCPGAYIEWYRCPKDAGVFSPGAVPPTCVKVLEGSEEFDYTVTNSDIDYEIVGVGRCPDPSTPTGYGDAFVIGTTEAVEPDLTLYSYVRFNGVTFDNLTGTTSVVSSWRNISPGSYATIGGISEFLSGIRREVYGVMVGPPIGPEPWRAYSYAIQSGPSYGIFQLYLGALGINENGNPFSFGAEIVKGGNANIEDPPYVVNAPPFSFYISGNWEFSNNQTTVEVSWQGRNTVNIQALIDQYTAYYTP